MIILSDVSWAISPASEIEGGEVWLVFASPRLERPRFVAPAAQHWWQHRLLYLSGSPKCHVAMLQWIVTSSSKCVRRSRYWSAGLVLG